MISLLTIVALLAFFAVSHLVHRFREEQKALARHLYAEGQTAMETGKPARAVAYFRAALEYNRTDFQYQLNLARALRDTGLTDEAKSYLMNLWESSPDDGTVNLALARLAVRENSLAEAIHYYHNATYGLWESDAETHRRNAQFELIDFLLRQNARPQALAELITLAASLPPNPQLEIQVAQRFASLGDYGRAFSEYEAAIHHDRQNAVAQAGAGEAAFQLRQYGTAEKYLSAAVRIDPQNENAQELLKTARLTIQIDPFIHRISSAERTRRIRLAFYRAGQRLESCVNTETGPEANSEPSPQKAETQANNTVNQKGSHADNSSSDLASLHQNWLAMKPHLSRRRTSIDSDEGDQMMDLVFQIEQQIPTSCGAPTDIDQALLLLSQNRDGVDQ